MSVDSEGSNEKKPQQQQQQQQQNLSAQDLNFSLNDILSNNHHDVNDSSFQSIVQTLSNNNNEQHITPSYAHLPAELQDLFSNETDDLLSTQGNNSDASILSGIWNQQSQPNFLNSPASSSNTKPSPSHSNISTPSITTTPQHQQTPSPLPQPQQPPPQQIQPPQQQQQASSTTLLDNITSKLPPERKDRFIQLFRELQSSNVSADSFLTQAKSLLGEQQYQQLEDLKNKPIAQKPDDRKRALTSSQIRAEDAQRSMPTTPQLKRAKTEHIPLPLQQQPMQFPPQTMQQQQQMQHLQMTLQNQHMQMLQQQQHMQQQLHQQQQQQQHNALPQGTMTVQPVIPMTPQQSNPPLPINIAQPVFKTPAVPMTPGLQIPTKTNAQVTSKPTPTTPVAAAPASSGGGGGGDSRIDYEALTDVMGYTGVDLKEESELFMSNAETMSGALPDGVDRSKVQDFMNVDMLKTRILKYAKCVDIKEIDGDFVSYLALAAQDRIRTVMESMVSASKHRTYTPFKKPPLTAEGHAMFKIQVKQNVKLQLEAIQRVSRQTELDLDPPIEDEPMQPMTNEKGWYSKNSSPPMKPDRKERKITVQDAIFVMERDVQGGRGINQKALLRAYSEYLT